MIKALGALPALLLVSATPPTNETPWSNGIPPFRYQDDAMAVVAFAHPMLIPQICGDPDEPVPEGKVIVACAWREKDGTPVIVLPNPCLAQGHYAQIACHELGHRNGWGPMHGD